MCWYDYQVIDKHQFAGAVAICTHEDLQMLYSVTHEVEVTILMAVVSLAPMTMAVVVRLT